LSQFHSECQTKLIRLSQTFILTRFYVENQNNPTQHV
jgi:hypothetical protein